MWMEEWRLRVEISESVMVQVEHTEDKQAVRVDAPDGAPVHLREVVCLLYLHAHAHSEFRECRTHPA